MCEVNTEAGQVCCLENDPQKPGAISSLATPIAAIGFLDQQNPLEPASAFSENRAATAWAFLF